MSDAETASGTPDAGAATSARHSVGGEANAPGAHEQGFVPLSVPNIGKLERRYVLEAVESGFVSSVGPFVSEFEERFAEYVGAGYAVATSSGTAALHVALILLGVERDDEVMVSDFTFVGSINPIAYLGARAVLVDSDASWDLDPDLVEGELQRRVDAGEPLPKVLEVVHVLGQPADMGRLVEICERFGVAVLEDAAESLGATWTTGELAGRHTGTVGRIGCYSFNGNKVATTGGGGMLVTDDEALARRAKHLTTQAKVPDIGYLHDEVGYNYRLTNIAAGLGLAQLERLPVFLEAKHRIARRYDEAFAELPLRVQRLALLGARARGQGRPGRVHRAPEVAPGPGPGAVAAAARATAVRRLHRARWGRRRRPVRPRRVPALLHRPDRGRPGAGRRCRPDLLRLTRTS